MENKRGLSTVVVAVIMIVLVLAAVGIIWAVVSGVLKGGSAQAGLATKCLSIEVSPKSVVFDPASSMYDVSVERSAAESDTDILGVKFIFTNTTTEDSDVTDTQKENIPALGTKSFSVTVDSGINPDQVEAVVVLDDGAGKEYLCQQVSSPVTITG
ncbi:MAG TPA: hypothetical protein VJH65_03500 [Candidatus Nanoarchaeia archaeon]|nr:hypothetical protein [Candidatus Nanoarchaeia archaeon]